jgi:cytochrome c553
MNAEKYAGRIFSNKLRAAGIVAALAVLSVCIGNGPTAAQSGAAPQAAPVTPEQIDGTVRVCSTCHGFGGRSISPTFPRLAGQQHDYIVVQLKAFRDRTRDDPNARAYMSGMATGLNDAMIEALADYYSAQTPVPGSTPDPAKVASGMTVYQQGVPDKILSCATCHGANAEGAGATPQLAGQHRQSLERQLGYFASDTRPDAVMHLESMNLTERQTGDISAYLASLSGGKSATAIQTGPVTPAQVAFMAHECSSCHEFNGEGVSPIFVFPHLAGQQKTYLIAQLKAFRGKTRDDPRARAYMWDRTAGLSDAMIERLAAYYSAQSPAPGSAQDPTDVAAGRNIYQQGIPGKNPPCSTCHGVKAEGMGERPRLAGQYRLSLERQLAYFATNARAGGVMYPESKNLTAQQIKELSAYLAAQ